MKMLPWNNRNFRIKWTTEISHLRFLQAPTLKWSAVFAHVRKARIFRNRVGQSQYSSSFVPRNYSGCKTYNNRSILNQNILNETRTKYNNHSTRDDAIELSIKNIESFKKREDRPGLFRYNMIGAYIDHIDHYCLLSLQRIMKS